MPEAVGLQVWWLDKMVHTQRPLQEKMTLFWHGHLTSAFRKVKDPNLLQAQNELFRANALGNYGEMLRAISRDGAMIRWLDLQTNRKGAPNENYARELMELFTLGVGNYTEDDVDEVARAFTGWSATPDGQFVFRRFQHDFDAERRSSDRPGLRRRRRQRHAGGQPRDGALHGEQAVPLLRLPQPRAGGRRAVRGRVSRVERLDQGASSRRSCARRSSPPNGRTVPSSRARPS